MKGSKTEHAGNCYTCRHAEPVTDRFTSISDGRPLLCACPFQQYKQRMWRECPCGRWEAAL